ncbi:uncharacterized protein G2W53_022979 [Senna tora]|uniref:Uncharacterized protein n=1 Tax=Senna tora TaxID=362788 RepID=A0A834TN03_9FABA|nr:uncharacterized protein G2W53_022979 [Senna tora]
MTASFDQPMKACHDMRRSSGGFQLL